MGHATLARAFPAPATSTRRDSVLEQYRRHVNKGMAALAELTGAQLEVRSAGARVWDEHGNAYLDCGGYGVFLLGHRHPSVVAAVSRQLDSHPLATRALVNPQLAEAAVALAAVTPEGLDHVCLTSTGAEAVELALKLARLAGRRRLIAMHGGYHGKTLGALSVTGRPAYREPFLPLLPEVEFVAFGDLDALDRALGRVGLGTACVILEPLQAESGVRMPPDGYLRGVRERCDAHAATLVLDEIQTGLGRLGAWWGADAEGVVPDILLAGTTLSGGVVPVAATVARADVFEPLNRDPLLHSSTFGGNPLAAAAAAATIAALEREGLVTRARRLGETLLRMVRDAVDAHCPDLVREVRGRGLLIGIDFLSGEHAVEFMLAMLDRNVITSYSWSSHGVLRLTPPAVLTTSDLAWLEDALHDAAADLGRTADYTDARAEHHAIHRDNGNDPGNDWSCR